MTKYCLGVFCLCLGILACSLPDDGVLAPQEEALEDLLGFFADIQDFTNVPCTNADEWDFVPIGVQACGGPQGYIPYATTIDVETFLGMVADYNAQEQAYNEHYEIVSTCSLPAQPTAIRCENDLPVLVY